MGGSGSETGVSLKKLKERGAAMRTRATMGDTRKLVDTKTFNVGQKTRKIMSEADQDTDLKFMFNCPELNLAIVTKEVVRNGQDYGLRPSQLATKLALPYDLSEKGRVTQSGARAIYVGEPRFARAMQDIFFGDMPKDKVTRDMQIINIFNAIPSLDPFLLRDQLTLEEIEVNAGYLDIDETEWDALCKAIMDDFRYIVQVLFQEESNVEQRTQVLVNKMWAALDLEALKPLIDALQLDHDEAKTAFFGWKGIIFYTHKYERSLEIFSEATTFIQYEVKPQFPRLLRDGTPINWDRILNGLQQAQDDVASVVGQYRHLIQNFGSPDFAAQFREFLAMASDLFWLLGSNLAIMDHISATYQDLGRRSRTQAETEDFVRLLIDISMFYDS